MPREEADLAWIPLYIVQEDLPAFNAILRADGDLALLQHVRGDRWTATLDYDLVADGHYSLWHAAGGPLAIPDRDPFSSASDEIADPFQGWEHLRLDQFGQPFLGSPPNIVTLTIMSKPKVTENTFGMSSLGWIGNYFSVLGRVAPEVTKKRWNKLRRQIAKVAPRVPRGWLTRGTKPEVFALPHAHELLKSGARGEINPI